MFETIALGAAMLVKLSFKANKIIQNSFLPYISPSKANQLDSASSFIHRWMVFVVCYLLLYSTSLSKSSMLLIHLRAHKIFYGLSVKENGQHFIYELTVSNVIFSSHASAVNTENKMVLCTGDQHYIP